MRNLNSQRSSRDRDLSCVSFEVEKNIAIRRIIMLQLIPIFLLIYIIGSIGLGGTVKSVPTLVLILSAGMIGYLCIFLVLLKAKNSPTILMVTNSGLVRWRHTYNDVEYHVPKGSVVAFGGRTLRITPAVKHVKHAKLVDGSTVFVLPNDVREVQDGSFTIK